MTDVGPDHILHQEDTEEVIKDVLDGGSTGENVAIANATAITGGESPTEAEHNALVTKLNAVLTALRNSGIIPSA